MQIHFKKFEPEREYTLMVYDSDLNNFAKRVSDEKECQEFVLELCAQLLNELGIYITPAE